MTKFLSAAAVAVLIFASVGCNQSSPGGGTGASGNNSNADDTFTLSGGTGGAATHSIKQGDKESIKITVDRKKNFHQTVTLTVKAPDKIDATLDKKVVKDGEPADVNVSIAPAADAPEGEYTVTVTGTPEKGNATDLPLKFKVTKK